MGQPLSMDLRKRLLAAIDDGMNCRAAAARFAAKAAIRDDTTAPVTIEECVFLGVEYFREIGSFPTL